MNDYSRHYAILKITHDTDWEALRARYKRLIGQWHPDRFPADATGRALAEEHSKQIIFAYQTIERYYRDHGVLPPMEPATTAGRTRPTARDAGAAPRAAETATTDTTEPQPATKIRRRQLAIVVLSALTMGAYAAFRYADSDVSEADSGANIAGLAEASARRLPTTETSREAGGITAGSTLGEVYAIQGIPTRTQGDTWHYGKSSIRFEQGKVVSWNQHPDDPLRIARDIPVELRDGIFDVGSTKDEVRSIQGTPVSETETVWDYGTSRVYFDHNRVVRWEASPLQPLRVPH